MLVTLRTASAVAELRRGEGGEGGIRTPGTLLGVRQFSKLLLSATQAPLHLSAEVLTKADYLLIAHRR
jgi:hypothetical protein